CRYGFRGWTNVSFACTEQLLERLYVESTVSQSAQSHTRPRGDRITPLPLSGLPNCTRSPALGSVIGRLPSLRSGLGRGFRLRVGGRDVGPGVRGLDGLGLPRDSPRVLRLAAPYLVGLALPFTEGVRHRLAGHPHVRGLRALLTLRDLVLHLLALRQV